MAALHEKIPANREPESFALSQIGFLWHACDGEFRFSLGTLGEGGLHRWAQMTQGACSKEKLALLTAHRITDSQSVPPFGSATGKNLSPVLCGHSGAKPMFIAPLAIARLKSAFHGFKLLIVRNERQRYYIFFVKTSLCLAPFVVDLAPIFARVSFSEVRVKDAYMVFESKNVPTFCLCLCG
jgi:hypothetical protein